jgi:hypothetical protein
MSAGSSCHEQLRLQYEPHPHRLLQIATTSPHFLLRLAAECQTPILASTLPLHQCCRATGCIQKCQPSRLRHLTIWLCSLPFLHLQTSQRMALMESWWKPWGRHPSFASKTPSPQGVNLFLSPGSQKSPSTLLS